MRPNQYPILLRRPAVAAPAVVALMADDMARASMGTTTTGTGGGQSISFDSGSAFIATIDSSAWLSNTGTASHPNSYRVSVGAQTTLTLDFDINPGNSVNTSPTFIVGIRSDGTFGNYVALVFDAFGHLDLIQFVASAQTLLGSRSATTIDNTGATTYHVQMKVDAANNYTVKINGVTDANLAGNSSSFASGPYLHIILQGSGVANTGAGIKNVVLTT